MNGFFRAAATLEDAGIPFVVVTFVSGKGHLPQNLGAQALVTEKGLAFGTVGGGLVEARAIEEAQTLLRKDARDPVHLTWNLQRDLGMTCGGEMSFLLVPQATKAWNVVVYGAGHVGQALVRVLAQTEARITCVEARREWREKLPESPRLALRDWSEPALHLADLPLGAYHILVTQDHSSDLPILEAIFRHQPNAAYVGVIGSRAKSAKIRTELLALGCDSNFVERVRCPMGLKIGSNLPGEIAVSVVAELLQSRDQSV